MSSTGYAAGIVPARAPTLFGRVTALAALTVFLRLTARR
jgi:hypothetical protein